MNTTIQPVHMRSKAVIEQEIRSLDRLISKRTIWLGHPLNKLKKTYSAVCQDTSDMRSKLRQLEEELDNLNKIRNH